MKTPAVIVLGKLEPFLLLIMSYIGWALGDIKRMTFSGLEPPDLWDLLATTLMICCGFYVWKLGLRSNLFSKHPFKKYLLYLVLTYLIAMVILVCEEMYVYGDVSFTGIVVYTTPLFIVYTLIFISYFLMLQKAGSSNAEDPFDQVIEVETFNGKRLIEYSQIVCFQSINKLTYALETTNEKYKVSQNLRELEDSLPKEYFFRANRQFIISRFQVKGYTLDTFQKICITWKEDLEEILPKVIISKYTAARFKNWLNS